MFQVSFSFNC